MLKHRRRKRKLVPKRRKNAVKQLQKPGTCVTKENKENEEEPGAKKPETNEEWLFVDKVNRTSRPRPRSRPKPTAVATATHLAHNFSPKKLIELTAPKSVSASKQNFPKETACSRSRAF